MPLRDCLRGGGVGLAPIEVRKRELTVRVDFAHHANLLSTFFVIILIDADPIRPSVHFRVRLEEINQGGIKVWCNHERCPITF